jgi:microcystin-dependent protein
MATPYIGEIRLFGGNFAPQGWAFCDGRLIAISQNDALFALIGTTYGGDGQSTFALPDLRGRVPNHMGTLTAGSTYFIGQTGGVETVTLSTAQIPAHAHTVEAIPNAGSKAGPGAELLAGGVSMYSPSAPNVSLAPGAVHATGGGQPHSNFQTYLCVAFIISLFGVFPSQN